MEHKWLSPVKSIKPGDFFEVNYQDDENYDSKRNIRIIGLKKSRVSGTLYYWYTNLKTLEGGCIHETTLVDKYTPTQLERLRMIPFMELT